MDRADLVQFTGGSDVTPRLYHTPKHPKTGCNPTRDAKEVLIFKAAKKASIPMAGICRGGQFLNVMCGGTMWQDVDNHAIAGTHEILDIVSQNKWMGTSTHHQMMRPNKDRGVLVAVACRSTRRESCNKSGTIVSMLTPHPVWEDVEVVAYPDDKVLCFQPHPEFNGQRDGPLGQTYMNYIRRYLKLGA